MSRILGAGEGHPDQPARVRDDHLLDAQPLLGVTHHAVEELDHRGTDHLAHQTHAADVVRRHDCVGARAAELALRRGLDGLGDDARVGVEGARRDGDEEVVLVLVEGGDDAARRRDARPLEGGVIGRVSHDIGELLAVGGPQALEALLRYVDGDEGRPRRHELVDDVRARAADAADDDVVVELSQLPFHTPPPDGTLQIGLDDERRQVGEEEEDRSAAEEDEGHGPGTCQGHMVHALQRFGKADGRHGDDRHVDAVTPVPQPPSEGVIAGRTDQHHQEQHSRREEQSPREPSSLLVQHARRYLQAGPHRCQPRAPEERRGA